VAVTNSDAELDVLIAHLLDHLSAARAMSHVTVYYLVPKPYGQLEHVH